MRDPLAVRATVQRQRIGQVTQGLKVWGRRDEKRAARKHSEQGSRQQAAASERPRCELESRDELDVGECVKICEWQHLFAKMATSSTSPRAASSECIAT